MPEQPQSTDRNDDGFILISVIWIVGLFAVMALTISIAIKAYTISGINRTHRLQAEVIADGLLVSTAYELAATVDIKTKFALDGQAIRCSLSMNKADIAIAVQDQGGLIDLNTAAPELLAAFFTKAMGAQQGEKMVEQLQDYRDPDSATTTGLQESEAYKNGAAPKNSPLETADEVEQLPATSAEVAEKILPLVTVLSQQQGVDFSVAPQALKSLLQDKPDLVKRFSTPSTSKIMGISVTVRMANGAKFTRYALVSLERQPDRPFTILSWGSRRDMNKTASMAGKLPVCAIPGFS